MLRWLVASLIAVGGCGGEGGDGGPDSSVDDRFDGGGVDASTVDASTVDASTTSADLTVHLGRSYTGRDDVTVLLGDGTEHVTQPDASGVARFSGLTLPEDVSIVTDSEGYSTQVLTIAGVNRDEIWLDLTDPQLGCPCVEGQAIRGEVLGTITQQATVRAVSADMFRTDVVPVGQSAYGVDLAGPEDASSVYDLIAHDGEDGRAVSVGVRRGVNVPSGEPIEDQDITLDYPFDQSFAVIPENDGATGGAFSARLIFSVRGHPLFGTVTTEFPAEVPTPEMDAAIDILDRDARVLSGRFNHPDFHENSDPARLFAQSSLRVSPDATGATVRLLGPVAITDPVVGTWDDPPPVSREGLELAWTHDPSAPLVEIRIEPPNQTDTAVHWTVWAPSARGSFRFFQLPASVARNATFPVGPHRIRLAQHASPDLTDPLVPWSQPHELMRLSSHAFTTQWSAVTFE